MYQPLTTIIDMLSLCLNNFVSSKCLSGPVPSKNQTIIINLRASEVNREKQQGHFEIISFHRFDFRLEWTRCSQVSWANVGTVGSPLEFVLY